jgi:hypothetical protein
MTELDCGAEWIGAVNRENQRLSGVTAGQACWPAKVVLWQFGALTDDGRQRPAAKPIADGITCFRAALASSAQGRQS